MVEWLALRAGSRLLLMPQAEAMELAPKQSAEADDPLASRSEGALACSSARPIYGDTPSLTDLDDGNLKMTTDFRRVYATMISGWMESNSSAILIDGHAPLPAFA